VNQRIFRASENNSLIAEIQLLRAVSILIVIGFHMGWPLFRFGFLGVDIFFVISGYFMYNMFSISTNNKIKNFYFKRLTRLLPAYLMVSLTATVLFFIVSLPFERSILFVQNLFANLVLSNFYFWTQNQYFTDGELRPFLTFWSLALEIQFYFIFPFIYYVLKKYRFLFWSILGVSLSVYIFLSFYSTETAFFMLPSRLWQFQIGVLGAHFASKRIKTLLSIFQIKVIVLFLLCIILGLGIFLEQRHFIHNILVTLITGIVISQCRTNKHTNNLVNSFGLSVGKYSYSLYLTHLPIISFVCYEPFKGNLTPTSLHEFILAILLICISSFLLYHLVENPYRSINSWTKLTCFYLISLLVALLLSIGAPVLKNLGVNKGIQIISKGVEDGYKYRCGLFNRIELIHTLIDGKNSCLLTKQNDGSNFLLIGNSHANAIQSELARQIEKSGHTLFLLRDPMQIRFQFENIRKEIISNRIDYVVLHSRFASETTESIDELGNIAYSLRIKIILIGPVPTYSDSVPNMLYQNQVNGKNLALKSKDFFETVYINELAHFRLLSPEIFLFVNPLDFFCKPICKLTDERSASPLYFDNHHLTNKGAQLLVNNAWEKISNFLIK
jgi:peptidoglycan/LPS O-acetylase OafA/YrhL